MDDAELAKALVRLRRGPGMTSEQVGDEHELLGFLGAADVAEAIATINAAIKQVRPGRPQAAVRNALLPQHVREGEFRNLTARRNRFLQVEKRIQDRQLRNYETDGTAKLVSILLNLVKSRKEETMHDKISGLWLKVTESGGSFVVEFNNDGSLKERPLFGSEPGWEGSWEDDTIDGQAVIMTEIGDYATAFTFQGEKRLSGSERTFDDVDNASEQEQRDREIQVMLFKLV